MMKKVFCFLFIYMLFMTYSFGKDIRFAQITDVNYSKGHDNTALHNVIKDINKQKNIDFVVFTGDNIQKPDKKDLESFLKEAKKLKKSFYVLIGDREVNKYKNLSKKEYADILRKNLKNYRNNNLNYAFERGGVVFIVVDGAKDVIPSTNGYFKEDVLDWLNANLDLYQKKNVVILQHFPLIPPEDNESYMTLKTDKYLDIVKKHSNVISIISGHFGINKEENIDGVVHVSTAPIPNYRIIDIVDCNTKTPSIWAEIRTAE